MSGCRTSRRADWVRLGLAFAVGVLLADRAGFGLSAAGAQTPPVGARGIFAFSGQLDAGSHGLFMLDVDQGTLWCYEIERAQGVRSLRLVAARSWVYDRYLENFNVSGLEPKAVQELVAAQRGSARPTERAPRSLPESDENP